MLKSVLGVLWRGAPARARRWGVWFVEPRFTVTVAAVIQNEAGQVLLLKHVFRKGNGWGIPGGFIGAGENPQDALRRELCEEVNLEIKDLELAFARTFKRPQQVEIVYRCRAAGTAEPQSIEINALAWFDPENLPADLPREQHKLIERALETS